MANESDEEYFDATDTSSHVPAVLHVPADEHSYISPSISISTFEGDPPEVEEDKDFNDTDDCEGK